MGLCWYGFGGKSINGLIKETKQIHQPTNRPINQPTHHQHPPTNQCQIEAVNRSVNTRYQSIPGTSQYHVSIKQCQSVNINHKTVKPTIYNQPGEGETPRKVTSTSAKVGPMAFQFCARQISTAADASSRIE